MNVQYLENPQECYKTVKAKYEGETLKYKMKSLRTKPIERPNNPIIQSIAKRFMTQRYSELIYSSNYGVNWEKFIGRDLTSELAIDIEEEIKQAMSVCEYIENTTVSVVGLDGSRVLVNCEVTLKDGYVVNMRNGINI